MMKMRYRSAVSILWRWNMLYTFVRSQLSLRANQLTLRFCVRSSASISFPMWISLVFIQNGVGKSLLNIRWGQTSTQLQWGSRWSRESFHLILSRVRNWRFQRIFKKANAFCLNKSISIFFLSKYLLQMYNYSTYQKRYLWWNIEIVTIKQKFS